MKSRVKIISTLGMWVILLALVFSQTMLWESNSTLNKIQKNMFRTVDYNIQQITDALVEHDIAIDDLTSTVENNTKYSKDMFDFLNQRINSERAQVNEDLGELKTNLDKNIIEDEKLSERVSVISSALTETILRTDSELGVVIDALKDTMSIAGENLQAIENKENLISNSVERNLPSVVHIFVYSNFGSWQGSGVVVSPDGLIVTAAHVIGNSGCPYTVTMNDGKQYVTTKACYLENYDIGFIKIDANNLSVSEFGNFDIMRPGDPVYAIGSPWGYNHFNSVTKGVLSATSRSIKELPGWEVLFQTDCPGNPGNSGCPVYNDKGQIIGILVGTYTAAGGYDGIMYCVPSNIVLQYLDKVENLFNTVENIDGIIF